MKNETTFKTIFKKSIQHERGFALSLAAPAISGTPDIFVSLPGYSSVLLEAKWLKEVCDTFNRKIPYSPLQLALLGQCCAVNPYTAFGLIGFKWKKDYFAVLTPFHVTQIDCNFLLKYPYCVYKPQSKLFDVKSLFQQSNIHRINFYTLTNGTIPATEAV